MLLQLIVHSGYTAKDAFKAAGRDHDWPCCSCMENNDERIASFSTILQILPRMLQGKKEDYPMTAQDSHRKYMYDIFVKKEYSYLCLLTGKHVLN